MAHTHVTMAETDAYISDLATDFIAEEDYLVDFDPRYGKYDSSHICPELLYARRMGTLHKLAYQTRLQNPTASGVHVAMAAWGAKGSYTDKSKFLGRKEVAHLLSCVDWADGLERYTIPLVLVNTGDAALSHMTCVWFEPLAGEGPDFTIEVVLFDPSDITWSYSGRYNFVDKFLVEQCRLLTDACQNSTFTSKNVTFVPRAVLTHCATARDKLQRMRKSTKALPTYSSIDKDGLCSFWVTTFMACSMFETSAATAGTIYDCSVRNDEETIRAAALQVSRFSDDALGLEHPAVRAVVKFKTHGLENALRNDSQGVLEDRDNHKTKPEFRFGYSVRLDRRRPLEWQAKAFLEFAGVSTTHSDGNVYYAIKVTLQKPTSKHRYAHSYTRLSKLFAYPVNINKRPLDMLVFMRGRLLDQASTAVCFADVTRKTDI